MIYEFYDSYGDWKTIVDINEENHEKIEALMQDFKKWLNEQLHNNIPMDCDSEEWFEYLELRGYTLTFYNPEYRISL
jgi:hypothetical protein